MLKGFSGGLWLDLDKKPASDRPIEQLNPPAKLFLPLSQFKGERTEPVVRAGARVKIGDPVALAADKFSGSVFSPVSGRVIEFRECHHPISGNGSMAVIENNGRGNPFESTRPLRDFSKAGAEEILALARKQGVAGAENHGRPFWLRLENMAERKVGTLVVNAVEAEPYLCVSEKLIDENGDLIAKALTLAKKCVGAEKIILAVSDDISSDITGDMIESAHLEGIELELVRIRQKYPSGFEKFLYRLLTGDALKPGQTPEELGMGFVYADELLGLYQAVAESRPQITRIVTVAGGAVGNPQNLEVPLGTPVHTVLEHCGLIHDPERIVLGSAMRGTAVSDLNTPVTKQVDAILALTGKRRRSLRPICISCGKCVRVCPQGLMPNYIAMLAVRADFEALDQLKINECIECGSCAYLCPGRMPLVELIKNIKKAADLI